MGSGSDREDSEGVNSGRRVGGVVKPRVCSASVPSFSSNIAPATVSNKISSSGLSWSVRRINKPPRWLSEASAPIRLTCRWIVL